MQAQHALEQVQRAVEHFVVASVLDDSAGVRHRGAIAREQLADFREAQLARHVRQIHGGLPSEGDARMAPGRRPQIVPVDLKDMCDRLKNVPQMGI
jgi:hypothetical protein